jgi:hypothetical protein
LELQALAVVIQMLFQIITWLMAGTLTWIDLASW